MQNALTISAAAPRGAELLEEFLDVVAELARLAGSEEARALETMALFAQYWDCLSDRLDPYDDKFRFDVVRGFRQLHNLNCERDVPVACGALIVALNVEAASLYDEDAKLVRSLTALHLAKARAAALTRA